MGGGTTDKKSKPKKRVVVVRRRPGSAASTKAGNNNDTLNDFNSTGMSSINNCSNNNNNNDNNNDNNVLTTHSARFDPFPPAGDGYEGTNGSSNIHGDNKKKKKKTVVVARGIRPGGTVRLTGRNGRSPRTVAMISARELKKRKAIYNDDDNSFGDSSDDAMDLDDSDDELLAAAPIGVAEKIASGEALSTRLVNGVYHSVLGEPEEYIDVAKTLGMNHLAPDSPSVASSTPPGERRAARAAEAGSGGGGGGGGVTFEDDGKSRDGGDFRRFRTNSRLNHNSNSNNNSTRMRDRENYAIATLRETQEAAEAAEVAEAERIARLPPHKRIDEERQARALARWEEANRGWDRFKRRMAKRLGKDVDELAMTKAEDFRTKVEELHELGRAIPESEKHAGDAWSMNLRGGGVRYVRVGNVFSGLYVPVKDGMDEGRLVSIRKPRPHRTRAKVGSQRDADDANTPAWKKTEFLRRRHEQLLLKNKEEGYEHTPSFDTLEVVGEAIRPVMIAEEIVPDEPVSFTPAPSVDIGPGAGAGPGGGYQGHLHQPIPLPGSKAHAATSASLSNALGAGGDGGADGSAPRSIIDTRNLKRHQSQSQLLLHQENFEGGGGANDSDAGDGSAHAGSVASSVPGPSLVFDGDRITFESLGDSTAYSEFKVRNNGSTAVFYRWRRQPVAPKLHAAMGAACAGISSNVLLEGADAAAAQGRQFRLESTDGCLYPGDVGVFRFSFSSSLPGIYRERWVMSFSPELTFGDHALDLVGIAGDKDDSGVARDRIEHMLVERISEDAARYVVNHLLARVKTPPPEPRGMGTFDPVAALFERKNWGLGVFSHENPYGQGAPQENDDGDNSNNNYYNNNEEQNVDSDNTNSKNDSYNKSKKKQEESAKEIPPAPKGWFGKLEAIFDEVVLVVAKQRAERAVELEKEKSKASKGKGGSSKQSAAAAAAAAEADAGENGVDGEDAESGPPAIPERWNGSLITLYEWICEIDAGEDPVISWTVSDFMFRMQMIVDRLTVPPKDHFGAGALVAAELLSEAVENIPTIIDETREDLDLPPLHTIPEELGGGYPDPNNVCWALGSKGSLLPPSERERLQALQTATQAEIQEVTTGGSSSSKKKESAGSGGGKSKKAAEGSRPVSSASNVSSLTGTAATDPGSLRAPSPPPFGKYGNEDPDSWKQARLISEEEYAGKIQADVAGMIGALADKLEAICSVPEALRTFPEEHGLFYPFPDDDDDHHAESKVDPEGRLVDGRYESAVATSTKSHTLDASSTSDSNSNSNSNKDKEKEKKKGGKVSAKEKKAEEERLAAEEARRALLESIVVPKHPARVPWDQESARIPPGPKPEADNKKGKKKK